MLSNFYPWEFYLKMDLKRVISEKQSARLDSPYTSLQSLRVLGTHALSPSLPAHRGDPRNLSHFACTVPSQMQGLPT